MSDEDKYKHLGAIPLTPQQDHSHNRTQLFQHIALKVSPDQLKGSQFVFDEDEKKKSKPLYEIMFYRIGSCYTTGLVAGSIFGLVEHRRINKGINMASTKKKSALVNAITKRGSFAGNTLGVAAMFMSFSSGIIGRLREKDDVLNDMGGGAITGLIFMGSLKKGTAYRRFAGSSMLGTCFGICFGMWFREDGFASAWHNVMDMYEGLRYKDMDKYDRA